MDWKRMVVTWGSLVMIVPAGAAANGAAGDLFAAFMQAGYGEARAAAAAREVILMGESVYQHGIGRYGQSGPAHAEVTFILLKCPSGKGLTWGKRIRRWAKPPDARLARCAGKALIDRAPDEDFLAISLARSFRMSDQAAIDWIRWAAAPPGTKNPPPVVRKKEVHRRRPKPDAGAPPPSDVGRPSAPPRDVGRPKGSRAGARGNR